MVEILIFSGHEVFSSFAGEVFEVGAYVLHLLGTSIKSDNKL